MQILRNPTREEAAASLKRPTQDVRELMERVQPIFDRVAREGDKAVRTYTELFDRVTLDEFEVSASEIERLL